jgi:class 3 adenylate cyclase
MTELPLPVAEYLRAYLWQEKTVAYFLMDEQGKILDWGGPLDALNIAVPKSGQDVAEVLLFMEGLLPLDKASIKLPCVKTSSDVSVDVHLFRTPGGYGLLLLDATSRETDLSRLQQKAHELALLREKQAKIIDVYTGDGLAEEVLGLNLRKPGERKNITILLSDIRGFRKYAEKRNPPRVLQVLDAYVSAMGQAVVEEGGVVDKIIGDAVMALFGVLPSALSPAVQSLNAASRILQKIECLTSKRVRRDLESLHVGIGIASGEVVMGILGVGERRILNVIGDCVHVAAWLESRALPGQILIDRDTFDGAGPFQKRFTLTPLHREGRADPLEAFAWESIR